ncbi:MAG TPA: hypothetical protein ENN31_01645 [Candidatus Vogelbacteria bacterium]|nr:hypothetical protein [Candidatus Vogelbacteria bacterium]
MYLSVICPIIFLDPSLYITDIILPNIKDGKYNDGKYMFKVSQSFLNSIKICKPIDVLTKNIKDNGCRIDIFGAGKGGYKTAEQYHQNLIGSNYFFLSDADHEFKNKLSKRKILGIIKKRLGAKQPSRLY